MEFDITVEGLDEMAEALGATLAEVLPAAAVGVGKAAKLVAKDARKLVPVDTGDLRKRTRARTPKIDGDTVEAKVVANTEYALYVEMGTGIRGADSDLPAGMPKPTYTPDWPGQRAQPYMYPAYKANEKKAKQIIADEIRKAVEK